MDHAMVRVQTYRASRIQSIRCRDYIPASYTCIRQNDGQITFASDSHLSNEQVLAIFTQFPLQIQMLEYTGKNHKPYSYLVYIQHSKVSGSLINIGCKFSLLKRHKSKESKPCSR